MRIVILGDFHLSPVSLEMTEQAMEDINAINPDLIIPLGDFGSNDKIGTPAGIEESWQYLGSLNAPLRPILGNHDLQEESAGVFTPFSMEKALQEISGSEVGGGFMEFEDFRLMFVTTEPQPSNSCWQVQECYTTPQQFQKIRDGISQRPGVPIVVLSHAPPVGCGLRTVPGVHVRLTNAYLNQNHDPYQWESLYRQHPEIVLWFSAHYHLGHDHPDSMVEVYGTRFCQTQIHGSQTRDGTRQSRVLDITPSGVTISTLDHIARSISPQSQWHFAGALQALCKKKATILASNQQPELAFPLSSPPRAGCCHALSDTRFVVGTTDGFLWEADIPLRSILGTWHAGPPLTGVALIGDYGWRSWDNKIARRQQDAPSRFVRTPGLEPATSNTYQVNETIVALTANQVELIAVGQEFLWQYSATSDTFERSHALPTPAAQGCAAFWQQDFVFSSQDAQLWRWQAGTKWELLEKEVLAWAINEEELAIVKRHQILLLKGSLRREYTTPVSFYTGITLTSLSAGGWLVANGTKLWMLSNDQITESKLRLRQPLSTLFTLPSKQAIVGITRAHEVVCLNTAEI